MKSPDKMLKKLTFRVSAGTNDAAGDCTDDSLDLTFIYGIGTDGLSDFERAISDLSLHAIVQFNHESIRPRSYFGPLFRSLCSKFNYLDSGDAWSLRLELIDCLAAEPKEVVTAMAEQLRDGGCSSDCGCGCH